MLKNRTIRVIFIVGILNCFSFFLCAQDAQATYTVADLLQKTGASFRWDPYRKTGLLQRGGNFISFSIGVDAAVENFSRLHRISVPEIVGGKIILSEHFFRIATELFTEQEQQRRIAAIFIDPGHGGRDPGAVGSFLLSGKQVSIQEKDVVLALGKQLQEQLRRKYPKKMILMSRDTDVYLTLEDRTRIANAIEIAPNEAIIFISIHVNASLNKEARGFEVWFLPPEFRRKNLISGERVGVNDPELLTILNVIREEEITLESTLLARNILAGMEAKVGSESPNRGMRKESWYVVRNARMPSVLVEAGFITNQKEAMLLQSPAYLQRLSNGIFAGIENFIRSFEYTNE